MKTKNLVTLTLVICLLTIFTACQKVADIQPDKPVLPGINISESNWAFQLPDTSFNGTIDTAYTVSSEGIKNIVIRGADTAGNAISILLSTKEKTFIKDAYTSLYGRAFISFQTDSSYYASYKDSGSFTFEITKITDSVIEGNYKAVLLDKASHKMITIKSGTVKAAFFNQHPSGSGGNNLPDPEPSDPSTGYLNIDGERLNIDIVSHDSDNTQNQYAGFNLSRGLTLTVDFKRGTAAANGVYDINGSFDNNLSSSEVWVCLYNATLTYFMAASGNVHVNVTDKTISFDDILFEERTGGEIQGTGTKRISASFGMK